MTWNHFFKNRFEMFRYNHFFLVTISKTATIIICICVRMLVVMFLFEMNHYFVIALNKMAWIWIFYQNTCSFILSYATASEWFSFIFGTLFLTFQFYLYMDYCMKSVNVLKCYLCAMFCEIRAWNETFSSIASIMICL